MRGTQTSRKQLASTHLLKLDEYLIDARRIATGIVSPGDYFNWGPHYSGGWLDSGEGKAVIALTHGAPVDLADLYAVMPNGSDDLRINYVQYSLEDLGRWRHAAVDHMRQEGLNFEAWVNEQQNRIDITTPDPEAADLSGLIPPDSFCVHQGEPPALYPLSEPLEVGHDD